jgi:predicted O-methyltransferase YrrM
MAWLLPSGSTIVEIGSWKGKSTYCLAKGVRSGGKIIAIDPFDASGEPESAKLYRKVQSNEPLFDHFKNNMQRLGVAEKVQPLRGFSYQFVSEVEDINLLFIDGDHSIEGCQFDYSHYTPRLLKNGFLLLHDYDPNRKNLGPTWVIENEIVPSNQYKYLGLFDSLWVGMKR